MRRLTVLLAALLMGSAAGVAVTATTATAAACVQGVGVTVVVNSSVSCDSNGGGTAAENFKGAGHRLTYVQRQPGFVCRVDDAPSSANCVNTPPADSYWGLFWSDGTSGTWKYASQGVGGLSVPKGGWVAFVFQNGDARTPPSVKPVRAAAPKPTTPTAKPKPKATAKPKQTTPTVKPKAAVTKAAPQVAGSSPTPSASTSTPIPTATVTTKSAEPLPTPTAESSAGAAKAEPEDLPVTAEEAQLAKASNDSDDGGSSALGFIAGGIAVLLVAGMGVTLWRRRAAGGPS